MRTIRSIPLMLLAWLWIAGQPGLAGETQEAASEPPEPGRLVEAWIDAWNGLDGTDASIEALLALYRPDALHITGPSRDQRGTVTYRGLDGLRKMAADFAARHERTAYRVETETANEASAMLFHVTEGPWGGPAVAAQIVAVATHRDTGKREVTPGALFLQILDGKIRRARLYLADGERAEVEPELRRRR